MHSMEPEHDQSDRKSLRVLQIAKYFDPDQGGIERVTHDLAYGLADQGVQADVLCFGKRKYYAPYEAPFKVIRAPVCGQVFGKSVSISYVKLVHRLSEHYDLALLHVPNPVGMASALIGWKKPLAIFWHADVVGFQHLQGALRALEKASVRQADLVLAATPAHVNGSYLADAIRPKAATTPYPFDGTRLARLNAVTNLPEQVRAFANGRPLVLAVGRLVPYKGFDVLVRAVTSATASFAVCIAGGGDLQDELQQQAIANGVSDRVILVGPTQDGDLAQLYRDASIVVMPSTTRAEMYGIAQVEAMSHGCPVISTDIPMSGVSWVNVHGETGLVVTPKDPVALAIAIDSLVNNRSLRQRLAQGARRRYEETFSSYSTSKRYADLLRSIV